METIDPDDMRIPAPYKRRLVFQSLIGWLMQREPSHLIAFEPGSGKSITALGAAELYRTRAPLLGILVVLDEDSVDEVEDIVKSALHEQTMFPPDRVAVVRTSTRMQVTPAQRGWFKIVDDEIASRTFASFGMRDAQAQTVHINYPRDQLHRAREEIDNALLLVQSMLGTAQPTYVLGADIIVTSDAARNTFWRDEAVQSMGLKGPHVDAFYKIWTTHEILNARTPPVFSRRLVIIDEVHHYTGDISTPMLAFTSSLPRSSCHLLLMSGTPITDDITEMAVLVKMLNLDDVDANNDVDAAMAAARTNRQEQIHAVVEHARGRVSYYRSKKFVSDVRFTGEKALYLPGEPRLVTVRMSHAHYKYYQTLQNGQFAHVEQQLGVLCRPLPDVPNKIQYLKEHIDDYSPLYGAIVDFVRACCIGSDATSIVFVYMHLVAKGGMDMLQRLFIAEFGTKLELATTGDLDDERTQQYIVRLTPGNKKTMVPKIRDDLANRKRVRVVLATQAAGEVISLPGITDVIIAAPSWDYAPVFQAIMRAVRRGSASEVVRVYQMTALPPQDVPMPRFDQDNLHALDRYSIMARMWYDTQIKEMRIQSVLRGLIESSNTCAAFRDVNMLDNTHDYTRLCQFRPCEYTCLTPEYADIVRPEEKPTYSQLADAFWNKTTNYPIQRIANRLVEYMTTERRRTYSLDELIGIASASRNNVLLALQRIIGFNELVNDEFVVRELADEFYLVRDIRLERPTKDSLGERAFGQVEKSQVDRVSRALAAKFMARPTHLLLRALPRYWRIALLENAISNDARPLNVPICNAGPMEGVAWGDWILTIYMPWIVATAEYVAIVLPDHYATVPRVLLQSDRAWHEWYDRLAPTKAQDDAIRKHVRDELAKRRIMTPEQKVGFCNVEAPDAFCYHDVPKTAKARAHDVFGRQCIQAPEPEIRRMFPAGVRSMLQKPTKRDLCNELRAIYAANNVLFPDLNCGYQDKQISTHVTLNAGDVE